MQPLKEPSSPGDSPGSFDAPRKLTKAEAGRLGARAKWGSGPPRVIRLDGLAPEYRRVVHAFVEAAKATEAREKSERAA